MKKNQAVAVIATEKRYQKALQGAEKASTYAAAQRAVMEAKRADALQVAKAAKAKFDVLTKQVRFVECEIPENNLIPMTTNEIKKFYQLLLELERRLRRKERFMLSSTTLTTVGAINKVENISVKKSANLALKLIFVFL